MTATPAQRPAQRGQPTAQRAQPTAEWGQSTAELAIVLPVVLMLAFAVIQVGVLARDHVRVHDLAHRAARAVAVSVPGGESDGPTLADLGLADVGFDPARTRIAVRGGRDRGDTVVVEVHYRAPTIIPLVGRLVGDVDLRARAAARRE